MGLRRRRSSLRPKPVEKWFTKISFEKNQASPWYAAVHLDSGEFYYDWYDKRWRKYSSSTIETKWFVTHEKAEAWLAGWGERFATIVEELKEKETRTECIVG